MSYTFYKWLHISSLFIMILSTGLLMSSAFKLKLAESVRKKATASHGLTLLVVLISGFGLLARIQYDHPFQTGWFWTKLIVWLLFGMSPLFLKRLPQKVQSKLPLFYGLLLILTVFMVINKPL